MVKSTQWDVSPGRWGSVRGRWLAAATLAQRLFASSATPVPAPRLAPEGATGPHDRKRQGVPWCRLWPA
jgi:hypothetical protein